MTKPKKGRGSSCVPILGANSRQEIPHEFAKKVLGVLAEQDVVVSFDEQNRFIEHLSRSIRLKKINAARSSRNRRSDDIIGLIQVARISGDLEEAVWRSFLLAHFGGASGEEKPLRSTREFLCAFGAEPVWTWKRVCHAPQKLRLWLLQNARELQVLAYGNHRKYESKSPDEIWAVLESFMTLALKHGGPLKLLSIKSDSDPVERFDVLFRRLRPLRRFGRLGRFDFLVLLSDMNLISAEPASCYLEGSTGPLLGAKSLWGRRSVGELERLAADLAERVGVSPVAVEDALCNWQKAI